MNGKHKPKSARTELQKKALRDAYEILADNFDHVLLVCSTSGDQKELATDLDVFWKGGWLQANGLADFAKRRIEYQQRDNMEPK
jgi:hypothetical protein